MGARVRIDPRTERLYLDLHIKGKRRRVFSGLPDTAKNREILEAKAETIEREVFLGTYDPQKHFPTDDRSRMTVRQLYDEWRRKKASDVAPLTLAWYVVVSGEPNIAVCQAPRRASGNAAPSK